MIKFENTVLSRICWVMLLLLGILGWQGCKTNNAPPANNSNSSSPADVKDFSKWVEAGNYPDPPPTHGSGGKFLATGDIKSRLEISSLKEAAIVLTPQRDIVAIESVELAIYDINKKKVFSLQALPASGRRQFEPVPRSSDSVISGYVFNLDPQQVGEADKYFVPENTIQLTPAFKLDKAATAVLYLVNKNSEVKRKN